MCPSDRLPDLLPDNVRLVFSGTAVGRKSAARGSYYAGRGNRFWRTLFEVGLTSQKLAPCEYRELSQWGIGLTDVVKYSAGNDSDLHSNDYDVRRWLLSMAKAAPKAIAFNGKKAASVVLACRTKEIDYGSMGAAIGSIQNAVVFVMPSTSGSASKYWNIEPWRKLADFHRSISRTEIELRRNELATP